MQIALVELSLFEDAADMARYDGNIATKQFGDLCLRHPEPIAGIAYFDMEACAVPIKEKAISRRFIFL